MDFFKDPIGSIGGLFGGGGGGIIGGGSANPVAGITGALDDMIKEIFKPIQIILDDIKDIFNQIWETFLSVFGFIYIGALIAFGVYATAFILLL